MRVQVRVRVQKVTERVIGISGTRPERSCYLNSIWWYMQEDIWRSILCSKGRGEGRQVKSNLRRSGGVCGDISGLGHVLSEGARRGDGGRLRAQKKSTGIASYSAGFLSSEPGESKPKQGPGNSVLFLGPCVSSDSRSGQCSAMGWKRAEKTGNGKRKGNHDCTVTQMDAGDGSKCDGASTNTKV